MSRRLAKMMIAAAISSAPSIGHAEGPDLTKPDWPIMAPVCLALAAIIALCAALLVYVWSLRNRTAILVSGPVGPDETLTTRLSAFNMLPMGVPRGTVRAVLALIVTFGSVLFLALSLVNSTNYKFPETLSGILGAILGFYFGKGTNGDDSAAVTAVTTANADAKQALGKAAEATDQAQAAQQQATDAKSALSTMKANHDDLANNTLADVSAGLATAVSLGQTLATVLPGAVGKDIGIATSALATTQSAVSDLRSGDLLGAVGKAGDLLASASTNLPVNQVLSKAVQLIGPVLGTAFPPALLITTLIGVGSKLSAVAYAHWVARVMDEPYTPEKFSAAVFDSNAAVSLLQLVPAFNQAFAARLKAGDRAAALDAVQLALTDDGGEALFAKYATEFAGLDEAARDAALHDLQKAALDHVLLNELPADAGAAVGGPQSMLSALDKIRSDRNASAGLDMVMQTATELKRVQQNPAAAFLDAASHLATNR